MSATDPLNGPMVFCRVYRLPDRLTDGYCFADGVPITFLNVDWFEAPTSESCETLIDFIKGKRYFDAKARFLVLADHPDFTFTIDPAAPVVPIR